MLREYFRVPKLLALLLALEGCVICNSLSKIYLEMEARVGIGPFRRDFRVKITRFDRLLKHYLVLTDHYSVTTVC